MAGQPSLKPKNTLPRTRLNLGLHTSERFLLILLYSVSVRVRPLNDAEAEKGSSWRLEGNKIVPLVPGTREPASDLTYVLDYVFGSEWSTEAVYRRNNRGDHQEGRGWLQWRVA